MEVLRGVAAARAVHRGEPIIQRREARDVLRSQHLPHDDWPEALAAKQLDEPLVAALCRDVYGRHAAAAARRRRHDRRQRC